MNLFIIGLGSYRLVTFFRADGCVLSSPHEIVLILDLIAAGVRTPYWLVDPLYTYGHYNWVVSQFLLSFSGPFQASATLFIAIYWNRIVRKFGAGIRSDIRWLYVPFGIVFCAMLGVEIWVYQA